MFVIPEVPFGTMAVLMVALAPVLWKLERKTLWRLNKANY